MKQLGERGAYPLLRLTFSGGLVSHRAWLRHAPLDVIAEPASVELYALENCDAVLAIAAPENTRDGVDISPERISAVQRAYRPATSRLDGTDVPWVMCWYPTPAVAQDAGMTLPAFASMSAVRTSQRSTGTSSRTCAPVGGSSWTARRPGERGLGRLTAAFDASRRGGWPGVTCER
jgi:leucyl aminopeptidase (aminopeptidase T)